MLEALAIPEKSRQVMMSQHSDVKWKMIEQHAALLHDDDISDVSDWVDMLKKDTRKGPG